MLKSRCLSWCYINSKLEHYCFIFGMCIVFRFFKHGVLGTGFFLCHFAWGRIDFYRLRLCGKIFSWSPDRLVFKLTVMFIALVVFSLPLSYWQWKYYISFSKYVYFSIYKLKHLCHIKIRWWWCVHVGLQWQYYYCHIVVEVGMFGQFSSKTSKYQILWKPILQFWSYFVHVVTSFWYIPVI
jgi:hypothetical protein